MIFYDPDEERRDPNLEDAIFKVLRRFVKRGYLHGIYEKIQAVKEERDD